MSGRGAIVVAGPGYGKTTLLVQALERLRWPWAWCSCDPDLVDAADLIRHIAASIGESVPGFGAEMVLGGDDRQQVVELANEAVETLPDDLVLVLDDAHRLPPGPAGALAALARDLPGNLRLVVASRTPLVLPPSRSRVGGLVEIGEAELALTGAETADLLAGSGEQLTPSAVAELHDQTEGWVAGVAVAGRSGVEGSGRPAAFAALLDEVLSAQPREVQDFVVSTSVLERFTPEIAATVSGNAQASELARLLVSERLFTSRLDIQGEWYRYHHLLSAHLRRRLDDEDPDRPGSNVRRGDGGEDLGGAVAAVGSAAQGKSLNRRILDEQSTEIRP